jgi:hypothetical protein
VSGQLVGDVISASHTLRARGVSERGFHALIAIAEKASASDRTASVRWDHIRAGLYGASKRTAQRAVGDLIGAGLIRVVEVGFTNQHASRAPIYEILRMVDDDTCGATSTQQDRATHVSSSRRVDSDKSEGGSRQIASGSRHLGVLLDVSSDGSFDRAGHVPGECGLCNEDGYLQNGIPCDGVDRAETAAKGSALVRAALTKCGAK